MPGFGPKVCCVTLKNDFLHRNLCCGFGGAAVSSEAVPRGTVRYGSLEIAIEIQLASENVWTSSKLVLISAFILSILKPRMIR